MIIDSKTISTKNTLRTMINKLLFILGFKGKKCNCGFYLISHTYPELEFDIEYYPCNLEPK